nr:hypothetical protein [Acidiferrobacter thiooxydans]
MSFKGLDRVSLLTLQGRILVPFIMGTYQSERFSAAKGQCDLVRRRDGQWFLLVTVDVPDGTKTSTTDFLGVDLGVANVATDSDGVKHSGDGVEACRIRHHTRRQGLQKAAGRKRRGRRPKAPPANCAHSPGRKPVFARMSIIRSLKRSLPRPKTPAAESPLRT